MSKRMTDKMRKEFNFDNILVEDKQQQILIYWYHDPHKGEWIPFGGGPLYNKSARDHIRWLGEHLYKFVDLWPKPIREYRIRMGEMCGYPGTFYEVMP